MILFFKTGLIIVAVCGVLAAGMLGKLVGLWLVSEDFDLISVEPVVITTTGGVLGLIGGIIIVSKLIKPIFKVIKRDAKRIRLSGSRSRLVRRHDNRRPGDSQGVRDQCSDQGVAG